MAKPTLKRLDMGQLDLMWSFLQLRKDCTCTKGDVQTLKTHLDVIRQALIQKTAGQRKDDGAESVDYADLGTYINLIVVETLSLYIYGGLDRLEEILPKDEPEGD